MIETTVLRDRVWVNCRDHNSTSECAIYLERSAKSRTISEGDEVWWQGVVCFWTPRQFAASGGRRKSGLKQGMHFDIQIPRIGNSGVNRPLVPA